MTGNRNRRFLRSRIRSENVAASEKQLVPGRNQNSVPGNGL